MIFFLVLLGWLDGWLGHSGWIGGFPDEGFRNGNRSSMCCQRLPLVYSGRYRVLSLDSSEVVLLRCLLAPEERHTHLLSPPYANKPPVYFVEQPSSSPSSPPSFILSRAESSKVAKAIIFTQPSFYTTEYSEK